MAIAKDVDCTGVQQFSGGTTLSTGNIAINSVASGATVVVWVTSDSFAGSVTYTVSDGSSYTELTGVGYHTNQGRLSIYYLQNISGNRSIGITASRATFGRAWATSFTGLGTYASADTPVTATGTSTTPATGTSATLSQANMLILTGFGNDGTAWTGATVPPTTGYTSLYSDLTAANTGAVYAYKIVSATTAVSAAIGTATSCPWAAVLGMMPEASSGGGRLTGSLVGGTLIGTLA